MAEERELKEITVKINRVAKVVKGGRRFRFSVLVVVGDENGSVGWGHGKANEVPDAIRKASEQAKKSMIKVKMRGASLPHKAVGKFGAARVMLKPATDGTGVIAGGPVRAILECAGVQNILSKILGTTNPYNVIKATFDALEQQRTLNDVAEARGISSKAVLHGTV